MLETALFTSSDAPETRFLQHTIPNPINKLMIELLISLNETGVFWQSSIRARPRGIVKLHNIKTVCAHAEAVLTGPADSAISPWPSTKP